MFKKVVESVVCGAVGFATLYLVAKIAYDAGYEDAKVDEEVEVDSEQVSIFDQISSDNFVTVEDEEPVQESKPVKTPFRIFNSIKSTLSKKTSIFKDIISNPDGYKIEAQVHGKQVVVNLRKVDQT